MDEVLTTIDGDKGLQVFAAPRGRVDRILPDSSMPDLSAPEVLSRRRAAWPRTRAALFTEYQVDSLLSAGADAVLQQPLDRRRLLGVVRLQLAVATGAD